MKKLCPICLSVMGKRKKFKTSCDHQFHDKCLLIWVLNHNTCPICRQNIRGDVEQSDLIEMENEETERLREIFYIITEIILTREGT